MAEQSHRPEYFRDDLEARRGGGEASHEEDFDDDEIPDEIVDDPYGDTRNAIFLLVREYQQTVPPRQAMLPIVLRTQIYSIVRHRTQVDRDLEGLRSRGFLCFVGSEIVILREHYRKVALAALEEHLDSLHSSSRRIYDQRNTRAEVVRCLERELDALLDDTESPSRPSGPPLPEKRASLKDFVESLDIVELLQKIGFVKKGRADVESGAPVVDLLTAPHARRFLSALRRGREELLHHLKVRYHEVHAGDFA